MTLAILFIGATAEANDINRMLMADNAQSSAGVSPMQRSEAAEFELLQPEGNEFEEKEKMKILAKRKRRVAKI